MNFSEPRSKRKFPLLSWERPVLSAVEGAGVRGYCQALSPSPHSSPLRQAQCGEPSRTTVKGEEASKLTASDKSICVGLGLMVLALLLSAGCAAYQLQPLTANHPAYPDAVVAPDRPLSKTLAYTREDIPSTQPVLAAAVQQEGRESQPAAQGEQKTVVGEGKVIATVPDASQIVVDHQEIKGFMEAMTMGYRVDPPSLLEGLKFGDKVRFTIDVPKKAIIKIEKMN
jgi:Cu/Ag efflux protein CusF